MSLQIGCYFPECVVQVGLGSGILLSGNSEGKTTPWRNGRGLTDICPDGLGPFSFLAPRQLIQMLTTLLHLSQ